MKEKREKIEMYFIPLGKGIENDYEENDWKEYAANGIGEWNECVFKDELLDFVNDDLEIAMVLYHWFGKDYRNWMIGIVPALEGLTGIECLDSELGKKRLKATLMRMR